MGRSDSERDTLGGRNKVNQTDEKINICEETPVDLKVNNRDFVTFMCTPRNLRELAVGYLHNQGLIDDWEEIENIKYCKNMENIDINLIKDIPEKQYGLKDVLASSCGNGIDAEKMQSIGTVNSDVEISLKKLQELAKTMFSETFLYPKTGGVHCAAVADTEQLLHLREDVGRHNAVDKIVGQAVISGLDLNRSIVLTSGRISSDMVLKAATSGVSIVVSRSIPSNLALQIAQEAQITVVGRITRNKPLVYTNSAKIKGKNINVVNSFEIFN